jgi:hypothetical protein
VALLYLAAQQRPYTGDLVSWLTVAARPIGVGSRAPPSAAIGRSPASALTRSWVSWQTPRILAS